MTHVERAMRLDPAILRRTVASALEEDLGQAGDVTTAAIFPDGLQATGHLVARAEIVLCGLTPARLVFEAINATVKFEAHRRDGDRLAPAGRAATVSGDAAAILAGERTALNFLMRMSGIASAAATAVAEIDGTGCRILDTRKTAPGLRQLDKYAISCGGASNHRMGLYDAVMIKDTHLDAGCSVGEAVRRVLERGHDPRSVTAEVRDLDQLEQAIAAGAGRALLDNMDLETMRRAVELSGGRIVLEASGGLRPGRLREIAATGVDFLSCGWLTHSAPAADLALEMEPPA